LLRREVPEGHLHDHGGVALLPLGTDVVARPQLVLLGEAAGRRRARRPQGLLVRAVEILQERGPARIGAQLLALLEHDAPELVDAELLDQELDARARAVLLLTEAPEDAADGLRD